MILIGPGTLLFILLLSFRPIRRFMLWAFILFAVFLVACWKGWIGPPAHAEMSSVVQCRIGSYADQMPDFVCVALMKGAAKITSDGTSVMACYDETLRHLQPVGPNALTALSQACSNIYGAKMYEAAIRSQR